MFCNKRNVNILTSILLERGITNATVCPGSRNAPITHNFKETGSIKCHSVTDERTAGFTALGIALATKKPVVVCVTSGSALLNTAPAVAEAYYQHVPLIVISADRPLQWIDQLDGQTIRQAGCLEKFTAKSVTLPEPVDDETAWFCNRLINEAISCATQGEGAPVHINVPIGEPLFGFTTPALPAERVIKTIKLPVLPCLPDELRKKTDAASRPIFVIGQVQKGAIGRQTMKTLQNKYVTFCEPLANYCYTTIHFDEAIRVVGEREEYLPDLIIYVGNNIVSKATRRFLRRAKCDTCMLTLSDNAFSDPTMSLSDIIQCPDWKSIDMILTELCKLDDSEHGAETEKEDQGRNALRQSFFGKWNRILQAAASVAENYEPRYSQMSAVKYFEEQLDDLDFNIDIHYANSTAIRLACIYSAHYVWCNRGVNGIEGSLSTAVGFSMATDEMTVCVIGDLSFFYDQNALWNRHAGGNLRIVMLNNRGGGIFRQVPGIEESPAADELIAATHNTTAEGICSQNDIGYIKACNAQEMQCGIVTLLTREATRPMLLEVITNAEDDAEAMAEYFKQTKEHLAHIMQTLQ